MPPLDWDSYPNFSPSEFACKCGECGSDGHEMDMNFMYALQQLRDRLGFPFIVTSGYRCPEYNDRIASTGRDGPHTTGRAVDISVSGENAFRLITQSSLGGWMRGIGINQKGPHNKRFVHLDDLEGPDHPRPRIWSY